MQPIDIFQDFLKYLYRVRRTRTIARIDAHPDDSKEDDQPQIEGKRRRRQKLDAKTRIVVIILYAMTLAFVASLLGILYFAVFVRDTTIPSVLHDIFFGTLGYFGGAFTSYLENNAD